MIDISALVAAERRQRAPDVSKSAVMPSEEQAETNVVAVAAELQAIAAVDAACRKWGFFHVTGHGVDQGVMAAFDAQARAFFALPREAKEAVKRTASNSRGWFDDELTKQTRDWKECIDIGVVDESTAPTSSVSVPTFTDTVLPTGPTRTVEAEKKTGAAIGAGKDAPLPPHLDGVNQWPAEDAVPGFRVAVELYFRECTRLSAILLRACAAGLQLGRMTAEAGGDPSLVLPPYVWGNEDLWDFQPHTSYLRVNFYDVCPTPTPADWGSSDGRSGVNRCSQGANIYSTAPTTAAKLASREGTVNEEAMTTAVDTTGFVPAPAPDVTRGEGHLAVNQHTDAGALTILRQYSDEPASLQVRNTTGLPSRCALANPIPCPAVCVACHCPEIRPHGALDLVLAVNHNSIVAGLAARALVAGATPG